MKLYPQCSTDMLSLDKKTLRKEMLSHRDAFTDRDCADEIILDKLLNFCEKDSSIFTYISYKSEVDTIKFIKKSLDMGKAVYAPICNTDDCTMCSSRVLNFDSLVLNKYGILEPIPDIVVGVVFDAIVVPGAVFDINGNRIGYGKGYYDKFISSLGYPVKKIALCYDFQLLDRIPNEIHDVKMDVIITESRTIFL